MNEVVFLLTIITTNLFTLSMCWTLKQRIDYLEKKIDALIDWKGDYEN